MIRTQSHSAGFVLGRFSKVFSAVVAFAMVISGVVSAHAALVHHWAFEEPDGMGPPQVLNSASANHGTFVSMSDANRSPDHAPFTMTGRSLLFNGVDDRVSLASQIALPYLSNFSVSFWYKGTEAADTSTDWGSTLLGRNNNDVYAEITLRGGKVEYLHYNGAWQHNIASTTSINDDVWHHVAIVNRVTGFADLYVDGVMEVFNQSSATNGGPAFPLRIDGFMHGFNTNPAFNYTQGLLDEIRIYDHALTAAEVTELAMIAAPEPSTGLLLLGGLLLGRRFKRRQNVGLLETRGR